MGQRRAELRAAQRRKDGAVGCYSNSAEEGGTVRSCSGSASPGGRAAHPRQRAPKLRRGRSGLRSWRAVRPDFPKKPNASHMCARIKFTHI
jgi:hypothetical protein